MKDRTWDDLTIAKVAPQIRRGKLSPVDLTNAVFERIEKLNSTLNAFLTLTKDQALADAKERTRRFAREFIVAHYTGCRSRSRII